MGEGATRPGASASHRARVTWNPGTATPNSACTSGDEAEYRRIRTELLKLAKTTDPQGCRAHRPLLPPPARLGGRWAGDRLDQPRWTQNAQSRAGSCRTSASPRRWPNTVLRTWRVRSLCWTGRPCESWGRRAHLLAMVQHGLGQTGAAGDSLSAAAASYDWDPTKATDREAWMYHLLRREAETVLASTP